MRRVSPLSRLEGMDYRQACSLVPGQGRVCYQLSYLINIGNMYFKLNQLQYKKLQIHSYLAKSKLSNKEINLLYYSDQGHIP